MYYIYDSNWISLNCNNFYFCASAIISIFKGAINICFQANFIYVHILLIIQHWDIRNLLQIRRITRRQYFYMLNISIYHKLLDVIKCCMDINNSLFFILNRYKRVRRNRNERNIFSLYWEYFTTSIFNCVKFSLI